MRLLLKYLFWLLSIFTLIIFFLLGTELGHKATGDLFSQYLSKKTDNNIEILSLNMNHYPKLLVEMTINKKSQLSLIGIATSQEMNMKYHLVGDAFKWKNFHIDSPIDINGVMQGQYSKLAIKGEGKLFDGKSKFSYLKEGSVIKDLNMKLSEANSTKLLHFIKVEPMVLGKTDLEAQFELFSTYKKQGFVTIQIVKGFMPKIVPDIPLKLKSKIVFDDMNYKIFAEVNSEIGKLVVTEASYHKSKKEAYAKYDLKLKDLSYFETLLHHKYRGELNTIGKIEYRDKKISIIGNTDKFDGNLDYIYKDNNLDLNLEGTSLVKMLREYNYPALLSANVYGNINYNIEDGILFIDTKLKETRFRETKMTNMIYNTTGIDVLKDRYDESSFVAGYQNGRVSATLKIDNGINHLYLTDTVLNKKSNGIDSKFEVLMQGQELYGTIYGTLEDPSVSIDMKKLLKSQVKKKFGAWLGTDKREKIRGKLDDIQNDVKQKASSLMDGFFQ